MNNRISALLSIMNLLGDEWGHYKEEKIPFEELEKEYLLIKQKKSKLSRMQRDIIIRLYNKRKNEDSKQVNKPFFPKYFNPK